MIRLDDQITIRDVYMILAQFDCKLHREGTDYVIQYATPRQSHSLEKAESSYDPDAAKNIKAR